MKSFTVVALLAVAIFASAYSKNIEPRYADKDFLIKQKFILEIFQHVYQDDVFVTKYDQSYYEYKPWEHKDYYNNLERHLSFFELWQNKPFYDDEVFSVLYDRHVEYAYGLIRLFYDAKDWNAFTHTVFWARLRVNKQLFVYSLNVAALFRRDLEGIVLPAIYEVYPWYFFDADTIELAEKYRMHGFHNVKKLDNIYNVVIKSNYTNVYGDINYDHNLAYLREDVGINSFYYYFNLDYPYWSPGPQGRELIKDRRGELYFYVHWQLLARYYLERLSHDLGEIPSFNLYDHVDSGYYSNLHYYNGMSFPGRDNNYNFYYANKDNVELIKNIEAYNFRIKDFIDENKKEFIEAADILGNLVQGNANSINKQYYGSLDRLYRYVVNEGRSYGKYYETLPNQFMHYETSLRDPLFYEIYKEIIGYYWRLAGTYPAYTKKDLTFDGVKIDAVQLPEYLTTYFEYFSSDISNAVNVEVPALKSDDVLVNFGRSSYYDGQSYVIKARQQRLNHKPFEFKLDITSDKAQKAIVKFFIGPKYDENGKTIYLDRNYQNFFELDHFLVDLQAGSNIVKRSSDDFSFWVSDRTTYLELYQKLMDATNTDYRFPLDQSEAHCGVPRRLMLPRGKKGGMTYQVFFIVYPYTEPAVKQFTGYDPIVNCGIGSGARYIDALPFGFPFNRPVKYDYIFYQVDNIRFQDIKIVHKEDTTNVV